MIGKWFLQLLIIVFIGLAITPFFFRPIIWGTVLYGLGAAILNAGVLILMK